MSITSPHAGTTRDWVDATVTLMGAHGQHVAATLVDTAGVRQTDDLIEQEAITRTHSQAGMADVVGAVMDGAATPDFQWLTTLPRPQHIVLAINKLDRPAAWDESTLPASYPTMHISALTHAGLPQLMQAILAKLGLNALGANEAWAFNARLKNLITSSALAEHSAAAMAAIQKIGCP
jgi:tRNA modification GTPase